MNRRGFISLLAGAAGAPLVPWRGLIEPLISLPTRAHWHAWPNGTYCRCTSPFCNRLHNSSVLTQESLEEMLRQMEGDFNLRNLRYSIIPTRLIVSPQVKHLIDTDPVIREAARLAGANV